MGKLRNYEKIKWKPFQIREGNISVTNYWTDKDGKKYPVQSHLDIPRYSFFEILKWEPNGYYGKLQDYLNDGWVISFGGDFLQKDRTSISLSFFTESPESCFMLASWENMDHDEKSPDLKFVGCRPMNLTEDEQMIFMKLAKAGQEHIEEILNTFNEEDYDNWN
jgi:hypothetical protein